MKKGPLRGGQRRSKDECEDGTPEHQGPRTGGSSPSSRQLGEWVCLEPGGVGLRKVKSLAKTLRKMGWETQPRIGKQYEKPGGAWRP